MINNIFIFVPNIFLYMLSMNARSYTVSCSIRNFYETFTSRSILKNKLDKLHICVYYLVIALVWKCTTKLSHNNNIYFVIIVNKASTNRLIKVNTQYAPITHSILHNFRRSIDYHARTLNCLLGSLNRWSQKRNGLLTNSKFTLRKCQVIKVYVQSGVRVRRCFSYKHSDTLLANTILFIIQFTTKCDAFSLGSLHYSIMALHVFLRNVCGVQHVFFVHLICSTQMRRIPIAIL